MTMIPPTLHTSAAQEWSLQETTAYQTLQDIDISVVVTLHNYAQYIGECLDSVADSMLRDCSLSIELVIIDDASTDCSLKTVVSWLDNHDDYKALLIRRHFNGGLPEARNLGIRMSRGQAVFILDADNIISPGCLPELFRCLVDPALSAVYPLISKYNSQTGEALGFVSDRPFDISLLLQSNYIDAMAMFRKTALFDVGMYDHNMIHGWEDYDLWLSLGLAGHQIHACPKLLAKYRVHDDSMVKRLTPKVLEVAEYLFLKYTAKLASYESTDILFGCPKADLAK
ncbi:glycosyltransferase family 2 protein [Synechococcus sp. 1G10]|uniref:glycosyltransferase family 2 protein n=1 Tax=Synechococcus sp. 1G10 TaxID=2025605 RepID=UPI000B97E008|nr:glycosyltransferase family 2 protein [Synechococcus sp. 1G10]